MSSRRIARACIALAALAAGPAAATTLGGNATAWSLGNSGHTLVTVAGRSASTSVALKLAGGPDVSLDDIAYRPMTGQLYGYDDGSDTVYEIDVATGGLTAVVAVPGTTSSDDVGFDFNNVLDAARVVSGNEENAVFFPNRAPPELTPFTPLFYVPGDPNEGANPMVGMNAYTNAVPMPAATQQYVIDTDLDILATLGNNAGTLATVGALYLDGSNFDAMVAGGFDILSYSEGDNTAYALLTSDGGQAIYGFDLAPNAMGRINLTLVSELSAYGGPLNGFAVAPAAVPVPASIWLLGGALGLGAVVARRRRKAA